MRRLAARRLATHAPLWCVLLPLTLPVGALHPHSQLLPRCLKGYTPWWLPRS